jgi:hypothetical protein
MTTITDPIHAEMLAEVKKTVLDPFEETKKNLQNLLTELKALQALSSSTELQFFPNQERCPMHWRLATIHDQPARIEFIKANFDALRDESAAYPAPIKELADLGPAPSQEHQQFQARVRSEPFLVPEDYLRYFESLTNPIEARWFRHEHIEMIRIAYEARQWQIQADAAARAKAAATPPAGSLSAQLEALSSDPALHRRFFETHKDAILKEAEERRFAVERAVNPLENKPAAENL